MIVACAKALRLKVEVVIQERNCMERKQVSPEMCWRNFAGKRMMQN